MNFPTPFQSALINRAQDAERFTPRHKALWRRLFQHAKRAIHRHGFNVEPIDLINHWEQCSPDSPSKANTIALDDYQTGFLTIAQESGMVTVSFDNLEEYGDTYEASIDEDYRDEELRNLLEQERLEALMEWETGIHPVTQERDLPDYLAHEVDSVDPEAHLEPAFNGFSGIDAIDAPDWATWKAGRASREEARARRAG